MEEVKIVVYSGVCRCCFQDSANDFRGLWDENYTEGTREVYGEMIVECFALPWQQPEDMECNVEEICSTCVNRLRDAYNFKKQMIIVEQNLRQFFNNDVEFDPEENKQQIELEDNKEQIDIEENNEHIDLEENNEQVELEDNNEQIDIEESNQHIDLEENNEQSDLEENNEQIYLEENNEQISDCEDVDCLENEEQKDTNSTYDDIDSEENQEQKSDCGSIDNLENKEQKKDPDSTQNETKVRKWPKKKKRRKGETLREYRPYPIEHMQKALCAVREGRLSRGQAAFKYNVPVKTLTGLIRKELKVAEELEKGKKLERKRFQTYYEKTPELIEEIKKIIMYTNATIFKSTKSCYYCAYCYADGPTFKDPEELRIHTRTQHAADKISGVELLMRPYSNNEIIKLDILNLCCNICCSAINNWFDMFKHFEKVHEISFDQAYTRVIPYELKIMDLKCAICKESFSNFNNLDSHMNCHYNNYLCEDCGESFLSQLRLKCHIVSHSTARYPCELCGQLFSQDKYRKKHFRTHHKKDPNVQCQYCPEKFFGSHQMQKHIAASHKEKVIYITCELCGKVFDMNLNYTAHMSKVHKKPIKYHKCNKCYLEFIDRDDLRTHSKSHAVSNYCDICNKNYSSAVYLKQHKLTAHGGSEEHKKSQLAYCDICDRNYSSAEYLKQHMWKAHGDSEKSKKVVTTHCDICDRNYSSAEYLKQHMWKAHGDSEKSKKVVTTHCDICDRNYSSADYLKQHKWKAHEISSSPVVLVSDGSDVENKS